MNAKELIEAANEVLSSRDPACSHIWNAHRSCQWCHRDRRDVYVDELARHILATVFPDDDDPPSKERLEADGWKYYELLHNREEYVHPNGMAIVCDNGEYRRYGTVLQTMRKVRLVAALGE